MHATENRKAFRGNKSVFGGMTHQTRGTDAKCRTHNHHLRGSAVWALPAKPAERLRVCTHSATSLLYCLDHAAVAMSQTPPTASSSSNFQAIFYASMKEYQKKTKKDLLAHPLMAQLQTCNSPTDILAVLHTQVQQFEQSTSGDDKLTKWLTPTVNVLYAFSGVLGSGVGLVSSIRTIILRSTF